MHMAPRYPAAVSLFWHSPFAHITAVLFPFVTKRKYWDTSQQRLRTLLQEGACLMHQPSTASSAGITPLGMFSLVSNFATNRNCPMTKKIGSCFPQRQLFKTSISKNQASVDLISPTDFAII